MIPASADDIVLLHESDRFVAADKPAGWLSVPGRWGERDPRPVLGRLLEARLGARLWPVHRLDEEASGVLLFARDAEAHALAGRWFERRRVRKTYEALSGIPASGEPGPGTQAWRSRLLRGKKRAHESPHGKESETMARCLGPADAPDGPALAWQLEPVTGRPHQLRYEMARHGAPLLGDTLYGATRPFLPGAIALRCVELALLDVGEAVDGALPPRIAAVPLRDWWMSRQAGP